MHRAAPDQPQAPARRIGRWRGGLVVLLGVLLLHVNLLDRLASRPAPGASLPPSAGLLAVVQVRSLVAPPRSTGPVKAAAAAAGQAAGPVAVTLSVFAPPAAPEAAMPKRPDGNSLPDGPATSTGMSPAAAADNRPANAIDLRPIAAPPANAGSTEVGQPPPVYATAVPAPVQLHYTLLLNGQVGEATLDWRHDGQRYLLLFDARGGRAQPLIEQASQGGFDSAGVAPERFTDRRRGRGQRAANFRRDIGRIGFSGPQLDYPAWPGAQDRLSWLAQLAAIQAAMVVPLPTLTVFVVDARGGDWWRWVALGAETLPTALGGVAAQRWQREPDRLDRPDAQRVEVWLDPSRGHWPVQLRFTSLRSGEVFELQLAAEPALPPALPPASTP